MSRTTEQGSTDGAQLGVILAGGASRRMPEGKPWAKLQGRPLLAHAVDCVRRAGLTPVVCTRTGVQLPDVDAAVWREPAGTPANSPHPLHGVAWALRHADAPAVVLPVDLPLLPPQALTALAATSAPLAVLAVDDRPAALVLRATPLHAPALQTAARQGAPALATLTRLGATLIELGAVAPGADQHALLNVNDPATLREAARLLGE